MPADTLSPLLGLLLQGTGNNNNAWGDDLNNNVYVPIENAIAGNTSIPVTGGSLTLNTVSGYLNAVLIFTGTLTSTQTVVIPNVSKTWRVLNLTSGAFGLLFKTASGTAVNAPAGKLVEIFTDGSNNTYRSDRHEVGTFVDSGSTNASKGSFRCNGATVSRTDYLDLFTEIGTTWGTGDGVTTFTLPNFEDTGRFRRSRSGSLTVGTYQSNAVGPHNHTAAFSGNFVSDHIHGVTEPNSGLGHKHFIADPSGTQYLVATGTQVFTLGAGQNALTGAIDARGIGTGLSTSGVTINAAGGHTPSGSVTVNNNTGTTETRPEAAVVTMCIRY